MKKLSLLSASMLVAAQSFALPVGQFDVDVASINTDIVAVGTVLCGIAGLFLAYKFTRRILAR